jgi:septal ring factor EnvC (AmiA/AmiB activator)
MALTKLDYKYVLALQEEFKKWSDFASNLELDLQASHTLTRELNDQIVRLQHDIRGLNEQVNKAHGRIAELVVSVEFSNSQHAKAEAELAQAKEQLAAREDEVAAKTLEWAAGMFSSGWVVRNLCRMAQERRNHGT